MRVFRQFHDEVLRISLSGTRVNKSLSLLVPSHRLQHFL